MDIDWEKLPPMMSGARAKRALGYRTTHFQAILHEKRTLGFILVDGLNVSIRRSELRAHFENPNQSAAERGWAYPGKAVREKAKRPAAPAEAPAAPIPAAPNQALPRGSDIPSHRQDEWKRCVAECRRLGIDPSDTMAISAVMNRILEQDQIADAWDEIEQRS